MTPMDIVQGARDVLVRHYDRFIRYLAGPPPKPIRQGPSALEMWDRYMENMRRWREEYPDEPLPRVSDDLHKVLDIEDHR